MSRQGFTEKDWKLFRRKIVEWQEAYMEKLTREYIALLSEKTNASERFWKLNDRLKKDKRKVGVQIEMSRSEMIYNILSLIREGAIDFEDLEEFSDELKETITLFARRKG